MSLIGAKITLQGPSSMESLQGVIRDKVRCSSVQGYPNFDQYVVELSNSEVKIIDPYQIYSIISLPKP